MIPKEKCGENWQCWQSGWQLKREEQRERRVLSKLNSISISKLLNMINNNNRFWSRGFKHPNHFDRVLQVSFQAVFIVYCTSTEDSPAWC
jgi:hypothetical protein